MDSTKHRVWIELDRAPTTENADEHRAFMERQCELANTMLAKLADMGGNKFFVGTHRDKPIYCFGGNHGYRHLADRGEWFNLEYLATGGAFPPKVEDAAAQQRLLETVSDITAIAAHIGHHSRDSRADVETYIELARKFETLRVLDDDGNECYTVNGQRMEYMTAIEVFTDNELLPLCTLNRKS